MNDEEKIRAACMAEINANPGKPYEVVTRDDLIITVKNHGLGGDEPIVGVFDNGEVHTFTSGGQYITGFENGYDIMGFAPKKPREGQRMNDEKKTRAECMAEINANPGVPYEVVMRRGEIITVKNHGLGGAEPIVGVRDDGEVLTFKANGRYLGTYAADEYDIMGFAPKKPRELVLHRWVTEAQLLQAQTEKAMAPLLRYTEEERNVPITITIRPGHDD